MRSLLEVARANRHLLRAIREAIHSSASLAQRWSRFRDRAVAQVDQDLAWMQRMGLVRHPYPNLLATVMVQTIEAAILELAARDEWELNVIEAVLENFYWNALFGWRGGPTDFVVGRGNGLSQCSPTRRMGLRARVYRRGEASLCTSIR